jgi:hypothetical protein
MEIKDAHFYEMIVSSGNAQRKSRVFNLRLSEIPDQAGRYQIYYYDCGTTHAFQGTVIENTAERLLFEIDGGKRFEFKPLKRTRPK